MVPSGWTATDIGTVAPLTTTIYNPNVNIFSMLVGGTGFTGTSDQFNLASQDITGNALVSTQVGALATTNAGALAGVMFRDGTAVGSPFVAAVEQTNKQVKLLYRAVAGGAVQSTPVVGDTTNVKYVKLTRVGNVFSAFYSTNGTTWTTLAAPVTITMSSTIKAGLCDASGNTSSATSAAFIGSTVINDNTAPSVSAKNYLYSSALNKISFTFSEDVSASLSAASLSVVTTPPGGPGTPITVTGFTYTPGTNIATFTLATPLTDSNYLATLTASTTTDPVGNPLAGGDAAVPFFVLPGDVNRDGTVNLLDLNAIATNFGATGPSATFANGNVDFQNGINIADFNLLAAQFGAQIANPASSPAPSATLPAALFSSAPIQSADDLKNEINDLQALTGDVI
jgi:hypothetical protein